MGLTCDILQTSDIGITEHVEGDECKFAVWTGHYNGKNQPASESKVSLEFFGLAACCGKVRSAASCHIALPGILQILLCPTSYSRVMHTLVAVDSCIHACMPVRFIGLIDIAMGSAIKWYGDASIAEDEIAENCS